ncbi:RNA polymerase sigma factor SigJ [Paenibacillus sp. R14(2021)]|uniref:RNA polymerase sigma factor SigJ n=1 Tax=Paenibacillus sp. R14(2021) TaxID=2859228 RepID=UPI001C611BAE|nr:RNA polymerase sigma factor SigJ [Paenibacillus sp. R14(2021)]
MQELYTQYKPLLFKLAYQLTGSVTDAEDAVQDVFLKVFDVPPEKLTQPKAYLCKMVTNRCRDLHKAARKKREHYFGEWLPEPFLTEEGDEMEEVVRDDLLSYAMLVLLERLTPTERTVFVLREALGFEFQEIAELSGKSDANCRKLLSRARAKMGIEPEEPIRPEAGNQEWVNGFMTALKQGDMNRILALLDQNVVLISDGGGKVSATVNPIYTRERVMRFLSGLIRKAGINGGSMGIDVVDINGQRAIVLRSAEGIHTVVMLRVEADVATRLYFVRNPDKLMHVGA